METLGQRLKTARVALGLSQQALASAISQLGGKTISRTAITQWESGTTHEVEASNLLRACRVLKVTPEWLQFGFGKMGAISTASFLMPDRVALMTRKVPLLMRKQIVNFMAKEMKINIPVEFNSDTIVGIDPELSKVAGDNVFAFPVSDNSMSPFLNPKDIIIFDPDVEPHPGEIVLAKILNSEEVYVVRLYRPLGSLANDIEQFELVAQNEDWPKIIANSKNPVVILGTLIELRCRRRLFI